MNLTSDVRMVTYQLVRLAERIEASGREEDASRLREIVSEIKRLACQDVCADASE